MGAGRVTYSQAQSGNIKGRGEAPKFQAPSFVRTSLPTPLLQGHGKDQRHRRGRKVSALQRWMPQFCTFPRANSLPEELLHPSVSCFFSPRAAPTSSALPGPTQLSQALFPQPPPNPQHKWFLKGCQSQFIPVQPADAKEKKSMLEEAGSFPGLISKQRRWIHWLNTVADAAAEWEIAENPLGFSSSQYFPGVGTQTNDMNTLRCFWNPRAGTSRNTECL